MISESNPPLRPVSPRALAAAAELLGLWLEDASQPPLDRLVARALRERRYLNSRERRTVGDAVFGAARMLRRQRWVLQRLQLGETPLAHIQLWLACEGFDFAGSAGEYWLPGLPAALATLPGIEAPADALRVTHSMPDGLAGELEALLGPEALAAAAAFNLAAPVMARVNTLKTNRSSWLERHPVMRASAISPWGVWREKRPSNDAATDAAGEIAWQDEGSQLVALATACRPGNFVVEIGAGAGGKALAMAAMMQNSGRILAVDIAPKRLEILRERAQAAGVTCIRTCCTSVAEAELNGELTRFAGCADIVLVDAPCTGTGAIRRSPDARWRTVNTPYEPVQRAMLGAAALLVRPGGAVVYATCAVERSQNEAIVIDGARSSGLEIEDVAESIRHTRLLDAPAAAAIGGQIRTGDLGFARTWPHRGGMDAFFIARLRKP
ncbi:MAG: RsmB/NOP family class I SAM-dependent RNA methyltransferase [Armatimonadetes bacterium]|nr:RsmB/NOP family class I SAM-dependent RNA methyltransferase [Armatimonadota bacterium]MDE2207134.1 RsmB/NOP family class I SAM-dependent RNA methyltransferase [Armatimonadota bacterium]